MAKILKFKKIEKEIIGTNNKATVIPYNKNTITQLTIKEWKQKYLDKNRKSEELGIYVTSSGAILLLDKLLIPWEDMTDDEKSKKEQLLNILCDQLEKFESVKNKESPAIVPIFHTNYKEKYFSDFKINIVNDEHCSVLYLDMIIILLSKILNEVFYVKTLVEETKDSTDVTDAKDWIGLGGGCCTIVSKIINNKFMFCFTFSSNWSRRRGLLKKLNKKSILDFVNRLDSNHIFLY